MTTLYALPDHQVVQGLLPGIETRFKAVDEACERLRQCPGLVPVAIDPADGGRVYFADIGTHPLREWQFMYTMQRLAEEGEIGDRFATGMDILRRPAVAADGIPPSGLIFHVSRCGSTLLAKALARSPRNVVVNQGGPLQYGFWAAVTHEWRHDARADEDTLAMLRNLVLLMARQRQVQQQRSFVKLISWNVLYLDAIRAAFPGVPALFLYRDPVEVIASVLRETTAVLEAKGHRRAGFLTGREPAETAHMSDVAYLAECYARYFATVLDARGEGALRVINYEDLKSPSAFSQILDWGLGVDVDGAELEQMLEQYRYHSKDDGDRSAFQGDGAEKRAALPETDRRTIERICGDLVRRLDASARNLYPAA